VVDMVLFDRYLFAFTIASHILLVSMSIALIIVISLAEFLAIRRNDEHYEALHKRLQKVFVISFGVGTASGVVMAVEFVTLFPTFMTVVSQTGAISLFYAEVFAFFIETISLVLYVYYADYFQGKYSHWLMSLPIAVGALLSGVLITMVNAWMNTPNGFDIQTFIQSGDVTGVNPWAPFSTVSTYGEVAHVLPTVLLAGVMLIGGYFMWRTLRVKDSKEKAVLVKGLRITAVLGMIMIVAAGLTGSNEVVTLLKYQPLKYSAIELNPNPGTDLPEKLFGYLVDGKYYGGIVVPHLQSFLVWLEAGITELPGLSQFPSSLWPPLYVHATFDTMVGGGLLIGLFFFAYLVDWVFISKKPHEVKLFQYSWIPVAFLALIVMESGWVTDEVGRQPWILYNVMKVQEAANYSSSLLIPGILIVAFYIVLIPLSFYFFSRVFNPNSRSSEPEMVHHGE
jgi:cytochrome d ubiquinol oxidase subunit I